MELYSKVTVLDRNVISDRLDSMAKRHHLIRALLILSCIACSSVSADEDIPSLDSIKEIYVLGPLVHRPFNTHETAKRPVYVVWPDDKRSRELPPEMSGREIANRVLRLLSSDYRTVTHWSWDHENHRAEEYHRGGLVLKTGEVVGWWMDLGGLAYLDFEYNPKQERNATWSGTLQRSDTRGNEANRVYRVPIH